MPRSVSIAAGQSNIQLPNGNAYDGGATVILTDEQYEQIRADLIGDLIIDNGPTARPGDMVYIQGVDVPAPAALTSADAAGANPTAAEHNALRADVIALRDTVAALEAALSGTGRPLA